MTPKLGRRAVTPPTPHLPDLGAHLTALGRPPSGDAPAPDWSRDVASWPLFCNDRLSCCVVSAIGHLVMTVGAYAGREVVPTDPEVVATYSTLGGYVPGDPATDAGLVIGPALESWLDRGFVLGGEFNSPLAVARVDQGRAQDVRLGAELLGPLLVGALLPRTALDQGVWDATSALTGDAAPGSYGGHCMALVAADDRGVTFATWDGLRAATWAWWSAYVDEAWAVLHPAWVRSGRAPSGYLADALRADLARLRVAG